MNFLISLASFNTYLGGHWTLIIASVLGVALFGALAFFLRSWQCGAFALTIAVLGFLYQGAVTDGIQLQLAKDAEARVALLQSHIDAMNATNDAEAKRAKDDQQVISQLEEQVRATPKNDSSCLDADSARRLHNIK